MTNKTTKQTDNKSKGQAKKQVNLVPFAVIAVVAFVTIAIVAVFVFVKNTGKNASSGNAENGSGVVTNEGNNYKVSGGMFGGSQINLDEKGQPSNLEIKIDKDELEKSAGGDNEYVQSVKEGNGDLLTANDVAVVQSVLYDFDGKEIESSWGSEEGSKIKYDLDDMVKDQMPEKLRNLLLQSKVGSVFLWTSDEDDDADQNLIFLITVVSKHDTLKVENPYDKAKKQENK